MLGSHQCTAVNIIQGHFDFQRHFIHFYYLTVSLSWPLALPTSVLLTHCSPVNAILPNPRTLDGYTLRQNWSVNIYSVTTT